MAFMMQRKDGTVNTEHPPLVAQKLPKNPKASEVQGVVTTAQETQNKTRESRVPRWRAKYVVKLRKTNDRLAPRCRWTRPSNRRSTFIPWSLRVSCSIHKLEASRPSDLENQSWPLPDLSGTRGSAGGNAPGEQGSEGEPGGASRGAGGRGGAGAPQVPATLPSRSQRNTKFLCI